MYRISFYLQKDACNSEAQPDDVDWFEREGVLLEEAIKLRKSSRLAYIDPLRQQEFGRESIEEMLSEFREILEAYISNRINYFLAKDGKATESRRSFLSNNIEGLLVNDVFFRKLKDTISLFEYAGKYDCKVLFYAP